MSDTFVRISIVLVALALIAGALLTGAPGLALFIVIVSVFALLSYPGGAELARRGAKGWGGNG